MMIPLMRQPRTSRIGGAVAVCPAVKLERIDGRGRGVEMFVIDEEIELPGRQRCETVMPVGIGYGPSQ